MLIAGLCTNVLGVYVSLRIILKKRPTFDTYVIVIVSTMWTFKAILPILFAVFNAAAINNLVSEIFINCAFVITKKIFNYSSQRDSFISAISKALFNCENAVIYEKVFCILHGERKRKVHKTCILQLQAFSIQLRLHFPTLSVVFFDFDWKLLFAVRRFTFH